jgi:hypothetical protein
MSELEALQRHIWMVEADLQNFGGEDEDFELLENLRAQFRALKANRPAPSDQQKEIAREAGMLHGIDAYNEAMGY